MTENLASKLKPSIFPLLLLSIYIICEDVRLDVDIHVKLGLSVGKLHINPAAYHTIIWMRLSAFFYDSSANTGQEKLKLYNLGFMACFSNSRSSLPAFEGVHCKVRCAFCDVVYTLNIHFC